MCRLVRMVASLRYVVSTESSLDCVHEAITLRIESVNLLGKRPRLADVRSQIQETPAAHIAPRVLVYVHSDLFRSHDTSEGR